jgi:hypothetical protein
LAQRSIIKKQRPPGGGVFYNAIAGGGGISKCIINVKKRKYKETIKRGRNTFHKGRR